MSVGEFFAEHRRTIDARKAHLERVGITAPDVPPPAQALGAQPAAPVGARAAGAGEPQAPIISRPAAPIAMPSQADVLAMPSRDDAPMIDRTHAPAVPEKPPASYAQPALPSLLGVNVDAAAADEE